MQNATRRGKRRKGGRWDALKRSVLAFEVRMCPMEWIWDALLSCGMIKNGMNANKGVVYGRGTWACPATLGRTAKPPAFSKR